MHVTSRGPDDLMGRRGRGGILDAEPNALELGAEARRGGAFG
jgi:hypothetical protein